MTQKPNLPAEWRSRRTRHEPPVLDEAIAAAQCLTDHVDIQIEITAQLIGLPEDEIRQAVLQAAARSRAPRAFSTPDRKNTTRVVVVERRSPRLRVR
jgi:hypothetical protein